MTKKLKKTTAFLSAVAMVMAMLLYFPSGMFSNIDWGLKASAEGGTETTSTPWDGTVATSFAGGYGSESEPWEISNGAELAYLAQQVIAGKYSGNYFKLTADIDLGGKEWTPIGTNKTQAFKGNFSGDGHKIKNLTINRESKFIGLFGCNMGKITNVGIEGGSVTGKGSVGGVCGYNNGGTISNCYNTGAVSGTGNNVGGVCGENYGTIENCYNTGEVSGSRTYVSGVCGYNENGTIKNCYNTGDVSGSRNVSGVCSWNKAQNGTAKITNCYNTGKVTGGYTVGGVCGENYAVDNGTATITNCYNTGAVSGTGNNVGGVCGLNDEANTSNCYYLNGTANKGIGSGSGSGSAEPKTLDELCGLNLNGDEGTAWTAGSVTYTPIENGSLFGKGTFVLPSLIDVGTAQTISTGADKLFYNFGTTDEPDWQDYTPIRTAEELQAIGNDSTSLGKNYVLMEDIDLKDITDFTPIGTDENNAFTGKFSGNGHKIKNLTINSESNKVGLFGYSNGTIMNVGIEGGSVTGGDSVGGVCGWNYGGTITNCYNTGNVSGSSTVGGVCGYNCDGTISNCYNRGTVSGSGDCVGGVCGFTTGGTIANCYFDSTVYNGNAVGYNYGTDSANVLGKTTKQFTNGEVAYLLSQDGSVWGQEIGKDLYPVLGGKKVYLTTGECVYYTNTFYEEEQSHSYKNGICDNCGGYDPAKQNSNGEYEISNAGQLYWFAALVNKGGDNLSAHAVLTANIIVNTGTDENAVASCGGTKQDGWIDWTPIGNHSNQFSGTFDGQGHTISGLYFNNPETDYVGLFGYINTGTIKNVGVVDSYFNGKIYVGGVCGFNIANSTSTITNCYNTGAVSGTSYVGGVCGLNDGVAITNCYNTGTVSGINNVGAVCGYTVGGTIANCYYLEGCNAEGTEFDSLYGESKTAEDFNYGEVAYLLSQGCTVGGTIYNGDVWGQDLSVKNSYPVLGGKKVLANSDQSAFANDIIIYGQSATLDGMIGMNIYVAADDNYEWSASFNGNPVEKPAKDENGLYKFTFKVAAKDMDNKIQFTVGDKIDVTVSVSDYLADLSKTDNESLKNLADSMSVYGDAAKAYFSGGAVAEQTVTDDLSVYDFTVGTMPDGISYYGSSLILESETTIRHYFTIAEGYDIANFDFDSEASLTESEKNPGYYFIDIKNISAEKLGNAYTVSINGEDVITGYSALSYAKKVLDSEETDANLKNLVKALYIYNQNAIAYNAA